MESPRLLQNLVTNCHSYEGKIRRKKLDKLYISVILGSEKAQNFGNLPYLNAWARFFSRLHFKRNSFKHTVTLE